MEPLVSCHECGMAMYMLHSHTTWGGDWETNMAKYECRETGCQTTAEIVWQTFIPVEMRDIP